MYKLTWSFVLLSASMWIAGYMAIVLPLTTGDAAPSSGYFNIWATCGWVFMSIIGFACLCALCMDFKRKYFFRCMLPVFLLVAVPLYQYIAARDTARVSDLFNQRSTKVSQQKTADKLNEAFDRAHTRSEKNIRILLAILLGSCIGSMYLISAREPTVHSDT